MSTNDQFDVTSASLIDRARRLDPDAWQRLCEVYGPLVYRWSRAAGLQANDASDVGQEVFRTVARRLSTFDDQRPEATFRGWLYTITRHKLGDFIRKHASQPIAQGGSTAHSNLHAIPELPLDEASLSGSIDSRNLVLHRALQLIRAEFEGTTFQAFWRSAVDGQPAGDIAVDLGMSAAAVRQAKYRVLRRLRREMGEMPN